ncbi:MAG: S24 family peptidase [Gemmatimonadaceae bacterium]
MNKRETPSSLHLVPPSTNDATPTGPYAERLADAVLDVVGVHRPRSLVEEIGDPVLARAQERFLDWLTRDLQHRQRASERLRVSARASAFAERMVARSAAARLGVRCIDHPASAYLATVGGSIEQVAEIASAERRAPLADLAVAAGVGRELWDQECESWVEVPADVPSGRYLALRVAGNSMTPLLHSGDTVLVKLGADVVRDSVVVARCDDGYVVKRIGRMDRRELELLSLNPAFAPMRVAREEHVVLGTVVLRWCDHTESLGARG